MISTTACQDCQFSIQGHEFRFPLRLLKVKGYDVILGADWLYTHNPVGPNLKSREFSICTNGEQLVTFIDETIHPTNQVIGVKKLCHLLKKNAIGAVIILNNSKSPTQLQASKVLVGLEPVLAEFEDVFKEPVTLPPIRTVDHTIPLVNDNKQVNQRPYRVPHHQKNAMETLIKHLLETQMIRPSVSLYSSPVILVKKKDDTWRLCVNYKQLNSNTNKNKYPIPIIEDLLDELFGARIFSKIDLRSRYHQIRMKEATKDCIHYSPGSL